MREYSNTVKRSWPMLAGRTSGRPRGLGQWGSGHLHMVAGQGARARVSAGLVGLIFKIILYFQVPVGFQWGHETAGV